MSSQARGRYDAVVVGAGPNGLVAAITLARAGKRVLLVEANETVGGGARSAELTLPGFVHDLGSAIHPLGVGSPALRSLPLAKYGLDWIHPDAPLAHPLDDGTAVMLERSVAATAEGLGVDAAAYRRLMGPIVNDWDRLLPGILAPLRLRSARHPIAMARFGIFALLPARLLATTWFRGERARAIFAGLAAHAILPLERPATAAVALVLGALGHAVGWPLPRGGAQAIADALADHFRALGGEIVTDWRVASLDELPPARAVLLDVPPRRLVEIAGGRLPEDERRRLGRFRHGPGIFKVDWALDGPIPWRAGECARAATVHLGGTLPEIAASERACWQGEHAERPFVLMAQPSLFDPRRAPDGQQTAWGYCHIPHGSTKDMTATIEAQVERFAPGFRERILARAVAGPAELAHQNANILGGDIAGGVTDLRQLFFRPWLFRGAGGAQARTRVTRRRDKARISLVPPRQPCPRWARGVAKQHGRYRSLRLP
jgi:phytoene dehydrogenase-like protein